MSIDLKKIAEHIKIAKKKGQEAADKSDDGGSANLDSVVICGLKGIRETSIQKAGIDAYKHWSYSGSFVLRNSFGMGNKNYVGVQAMKDYLASQEIECYVHYQLD